jgi:hypothetical protein
MKKLAVIILLMGILVLPAVAHASFFDDSGEKWWMNQNQWDMLFQDPEGRTNLQDTSNRLELTTTSGWSTGEEINRGYVSKWAFDTSHDFEFQVNFHYSHIGQRINDEGTINMGLWGSDNSIQDPMQGANWQQTFIDNFTSGSLDSHMQTVWMSARNSFSEEYLNHYGFLEERTFRGINSETFWGRNNLEGLLRMNYNAEQDLLKVWAYEKFGPGDADLYYSSHSNYTGFKEENFDTFRVFLGGNSEGAALASGEAYLYNFQVKSGTMVTPEPISSALFLFGGGALVGFKRLRKVRG